MYICDCGRTPPDDYEYCGCGQAIPAAEQNAPEHAGSIIQGSNSRGVQAGRDVTAHQIIFGKDPADPYDHRTAIARQSQKRSMLPDNWVAAAASVCTIATFLLMTFAWKPDASLLSLILPLAAMVSACVLMASLYLRFGLQAGRHIVQPFGLSLSIFEKANDGTVYSTRLVAECPWCRSNGIEGRMHLQRRDNAVTWVCHRNQTQHTARFDPTTIGEAS